MRIKHEQTPSNIKILDIYMINDYNTPLKITEAQL